ncbi:MAG TPA: hypothetical protein VMV31_00615 [Terriglobales bacterium]|nr:hypothetical protein [Terriglobales bacterium]
MNPNARRREIGAGLPTTENNAVAAEVKLPTLPALEAWLRQRQALVAELAQALREGFQAVAGFDPNRYLDCIERQEELSQRIAGLDRRQPASVGARAELERAAEALRRMNAELQQLAGVQTALIEHGGRSVRCFQRVWAMNAPSYGAPAAHGHRPQER